MVDPAYSFAIFGILWEVNCSELLQEEEKANWSLPSIHKELTLIHTPKFQELKKHPAFAVEHYFLPQLSSNTLWVSWKCVLQDVQVILI